MNSVIRHYCNAQTSLVEVFRFFASTIENQEACAALGNAELQLLATAGLRIDSEWFGARVMGPIKYALGKWSFQFMSDEMEAAAVLCTGSANMVVDGPERAEAYGRLEFIGDFVDDVETVAVRVEHRNGKQMDDGSHLCSCREPQTLGLRCRHYGWRCASAVSLVS